MQDGPEVMQDGPKLMQDEPKMMQADPQDRHDGTLCPITFGDILFLCAISPEFGP